MIRRVTLSLLFAISVCLATNPLNATGIASFPDDRATPAGAGLSKATMPPPICPDKGDCKLALPSGNDTDFVKATMPPPICPDKGDCKLALPSGNVVDLVKATMPPPICPDKGDCKLALPSSGPISISD